MGIRDRRKHGIHSLRGQSFEAGVDRAAENWGFQWVEPMCTTVVMLFERGWLFFIPFSMDNDPLEMKDILNRYGVRASALSATLPIDAAGDKRAVPGESRAFCAGMGVQVLATDEGIRPEWLDDKECFDIMKYTRLEKSCRSRSGTAFNVGIEPHQSISKTTDGLLRICEFWWDSPMLKVNL